MKPCSNFVGIMNRPLTHTLLSDVPNLLIFILNCFLTLRRFRGKVYVLRVDCIAMHVYGWVDLRLSPCLDSGQIWFRSIFSLLSDLL